MTETTSAEAVSALVARAAGGGKVTARQVAEAKAQDDLAAVLAAADAEAEQRKICAGPE